MKGETKRMTDIRNEAELKTVLEKEIEKAFEGITDEVMSLFKRDYIRKLVYESHGKNAKYYNGTRSPTYQFMDSWVWSNIKKQANTLVRELYYNPDNMDFDMPTFLHGSRYSKPNDIRNNLPAILEGKQSSLWLSVSRPQKFWEVFISDMFSGGKLENIIIKHFKSLGMMIYKI